MKINHIYHGDCLKIFESIINNESIDLVYADPPYNLSGKSLNLHNNKTGGAFTKVNEDWDTWTDEDYLTFTANWLSEAYRVLKEGGSLYVSCSYHNIGEVVLLGKKAGFKLNNILTWYKTNAMPNITKRTFTHSTEFVCWFVKGKGWKFNYERIKNINPRKTKEGLPKQMRDFFDFIEIPILQGKERLKRLDNKSLHPTQKPEKLLEIIIEASSDRGDLILDPFWGTGTTGVVAQRLGRNWIGVEIDNRYVKASKKRMQRLNN